MGINFKLNTTKSTNGIGLQDHFKGLKLAPNGVYVGIQSEAHDYPNGTSIVMVAMVNEFGSASSGIPPRHFLSRSIEVDKRYYKQKIVKILKKYNKGDRKFIASSFMELGRRSVDQVQKHIETNDIGMTPNKPSTANAKGGNQPVVDTGHLLKQIDYQLLGGGK